MSSMHPVRTQVPSGALDFIQFPFFLQRKQHFWQCFGNMFYYNFVGLYNDCIFVVLICCTKEYHLETEDGSNGMGEDEDDEIDREVRVVKLNILH